MQEEISLKELYQIAKKHIFTLLSATLAGVLVSVLFMMFFVTPQYSSQAQLLVNQQQGTETATAIQYNEIQSNIQLINTYRDIITGHSVLSQVSENLGGSYTPGELRGAISVTQPQNSQAFYITATMETAEEAQAVVSQVVSTFESTVREVYGEEKTSIFVLSPASFNPNKVSPSLVMYALIGAVIGLALSVVAILVIELMDTTIKDNDFLAQQGLINLGQIYELSAKELKGSRLGSGQSKSRMRERV